MTENSHLHKIVFPSWMTSNSKKKRGIAKLHYEIYDYVTNVLTPTEKNTAERKEAVAYLFDLIKEFNRNMSPYVFGSFAQGLDTINSDIDIAIAFDEEKFFMSSFDALSHLYNFLGEKDIGEMKFIDSKVPIIKITLKNTGIKIDIGINNIEGIEIAKVIRKHVTKEPILKYIIMIMKEILMQNNQNEVHNGGMSSFMLFHLVFYYYQQTFYKDKKTKIEQEMIQRTNLGSFFLGFLKFYSEFDIKKKGISILKGGHLYSPNQKFALNHYGEVLSLESCVDIGNDIGRHCTNFQEIAKLWKEIYTKLIKARGDIISFINLIGLNKY